VSDTNRYACIDAERRYDSASIGACRSRRRTTSTPTGATGTTARSCTHATRWATDSTAFVATRRCSATASTSIAATSATSPDAGCSTSSATSAPTRSRSLAWEPRSTDSTSPADPWAQRDLFASVETAGDQITNTGTYEWNHGLGEVFTALTAAGLQVDLLEEHRFLDWRLLSNQIERDERLYLPGHQIDRCPMMYSLGAAKPA
jgi:hypothetical protein